MAKRTDIMVNATLTMKPRQEQGSFDAGRTLTKLAETAGSQTQLYFVESARRWKLRVDTLWVCAKSETMRGCNAPFKLASAQENETVVDSAVLLRVAEARSAEPTVV